MNDIDQWDIFFYFDCLISKNKKDDYEVRKHYDNIGL